MCFLNFLVILCTDVGITMSWFKQFISFHMKRDWAEHRCYVLKLGKCFECIGTFSLVVCYETRVVFTPILYTFTDTDRVLFNTN